MLYHQNEMTLRSTSQALFQSFVGEVSVSEEEKKTTFITPSHLMTLLASIFDKLSKTQQKFKKNVLPRVDWTMTAIKYKLFSSTPKLFANLLRNFGSNMVLWVPESQTFTIFVGATLLLQQRITSIFQRWVFSWESEPVASAAQKRPEGIF